MIVVPNWHLCPTIRVLFSGEADWLICRLRRACGQLTYLPRLSFEFQVVKITSFGQKVGQ